MKKVQEYSGIQNIRSYVAFLIFGLVSLAGCTYEFPEVDQQMNTGSLQGPVIFIGDDYAAGFMNGALYHEGQQNGLSAILGSVMAKADIDTVVQALINGSAGFNPYASDSLQMAGRYVLTYQAGQNEPIRQTLPGETVEPFTGDKTGINDLTIPFLKSFETDQLNITGNPYALRILEDPATTTLLQQAVAHQPTTYVLWLGMTDVLNYAVTGGGGDSLPSINPLLVAEDDMTPIPLYRTAMENLISTLMQNPAASGIILTLPQVSDLPYFYYYPYDFMKLSGAQLGLARTTYSAFNDAVEQNNMTPGNPKRPYIGFNDNGFTPYPQPVVVQDNTLPDAYYPDSTPLEKIRNLKEGELLLLDFPVDRMEQGYGWLIPAEEQYFLSLSEVQSINARVDAFNQILEELAGMYPGRILVVDIGEMIHDLSETGKLDGWGTPNSSEQYSFEGVPLQARMELNSIFSLDGLHFNQRGCAWLAEHVVTEMNAFFSARLPHVDVNNYKGNVPEYK